MNRKSSSSADGLMLNGQIFKIFMLFFSVRTPHATVQHSTRHKAALVNKIPLKKYFRSFICWEMLHNFLFLNKFHRSRGRTAKYKNLVEGNYIRTLLIATYDLD